MTSSEAAIPQSRSEQEGRGQGSPVPCSSAATRSFKAANPAAALSRASGFRKKLILGEDDRAIRHALSEYLKSEQYEVIEAGTCAAVRESFKGCSPDAAILDYSLPDGTALELLPYLRQYHPLVPVILITGNATIPLAVQAMKEGAEQFLTKPVPMPTIAVVLKRALEGQRSHQKVQAGRARERREAVYPFLGTSRAMEELACQAERVSGSHCPVLIVGETGAGKGVLARWLHENGPRADEPFVDLNCAGFGRDLLETELFGHEVGAFTGAVQRKSGLLEVAQKGTAFLDEIGDMDLQVQPKLLKIIEEKRFRRLGDVHERQLDIRLIAASHQDLTELVREKKFRSDLYFRVSTVILEVPPLRARPEDVLLLAEYFLQRAKSDLGRMGVTLTEPAMERLRSHAWPGNIRELRNVIERTVLLTAHEMIQPRDLRLECNGRMHGNGDEAHLTLKEIQRLHIQRALAAERGNIARTATRLGVTRSSLYNKMKTFAVAPIRC